MLSAKNSQLLAKKKQIAILNKDFKMIEILEKIKDDNQITKEIIEYKIK